MRPAPLRVRHEERKYIGLVAAAAMVVSLSVGVATANAGRGLAARAPVAAAQGEGFSPGAPGIGDPYFPLEGNGGYDVKHYDLSFSYDPATDRLDALNKITGARRRISHASTLIFSNSR